MIETTTTPSRASRDAVARPIPDAAPVTTTVCPSNRPGVIRSCQTGFSSALSYYDGLRTERLPAALTQGLRDFFGAHTYGRTDEDPGKKFHTLWSGDRSEVPA